MSIWAILLVHQTCQAAPVEAFSWQKTCKLTHILGGGIGATWMLDRPFSWARYHGHVLSVAVNTPKTRQINVRRIIFILIRLTFDYSVQAIWQKLREIVVCLSCLHDWKPEHIRKSEKLIFRSGFWCQPLLIINFCYPQVLLSKSSITPLPGLPEFVIGKSCIRQVPLNISGSIVYKFCGILIVRNIQIMDSFS